MNAEIIIAGLWMVKCQAYLRPRYDKLGLGVFLKVADLKVCLVLLS
jgi:histone demethylase JARID1